MTNDAKTHDKFEKGVSDKKQDSSMEKTKSDANLASSSSKKTSETKKLLLDTPESLRKELKSASEMILQMEEKVRILRIQHNVANEAPPSTDHDFVKNIIGTDIRMLEEAYKGLRTLVFHVQDRLEALSSKMEKENTYLTEEQQRQHKDYDTKIKGTESKLTNQINAVEQKVHRETSSVSAELKTNLANARAQFEGEVKSAKMELESFRIKVDQENQKNSMSFQNLKSSKELSLRILTQYVVKLSEIAGHRDTLSAYGLDKAMENIEKSGSA